MSIKVDEMRRGLYRIWWTMKELGSDVTLQKGIFHLSGSLPTQSTYSIYSRSRKPALTGFADVCIMLKRRPDKLEENLDKKSCTVTNVPKTDCFTAHQLQKPLFVWMENEMFGKQSFLRIGDAWQIFVPITNYQQPRITLWMDFGTNTAGQTKMMMDFANLFINQTNCDVTFRIKGETFGAHIIVLTARSSVFAVMFQCGMQESRTKEVVIEDIELEVFKHLIHYIYTGTCPLMEMQSFTRQALFVAADKYDIQTLKEECVDLLLTQLEPDNAISMLVWSHLHSIKLLFTASIKCIAVNGSKICFLPEWKDLTYEHPDLCLIATQHMMKEKTRTLADCENDFDSDEWETAGGNIFETTCETFCDSEWDEFPEQFRCFASLIKE